MHSKRIKYKIRKFNQFAVKNTKSRKIHQFATKTKSRKINPFATKNKKEPKNNPFETKLTAAFLLNIGHFGTSFDSKISRKDKFKKNLRANDVYGSSLVLLYQFGFRVQKRRCFLLQLFTRSVTSRISAAHGSLITIFYFLLVFTFLLRISLFLFVLFFKELFFNTLYFYEL